jgi:hypothetical protein
LVDSIEPAVLIICFKDNRELVSQTKRLANKGFVQTAEG